jgi:ABC-type nitrate/sulfonate/bicarbonate transport system ATPase subunit
LLLLDEAFASLDEALRLSLGELLVRLQRRNGMMVLMISHDRTEIIRLADRVVEIRNGRNVFAGEAGAWKEFAKSAD